MKKNYTLLEANNLKITKIIYKNGVIFKFDNRRVGVFTMRTGDFYFEFKRLSTQEEIKQGKGKVTRTSMGLSREATELLMIAITEQMGLIVVKEGLTNIEIEEK
jgi:hypothetical protein